MQKQSQTGAIRPGSHENIFRVQPNNEQVRSGTAGSGRVKQFLHKAPSSKTKFDLNADPNMTQSQVNVNNVYELVSPHEKTVHNFSRVPGHMYVRDMNSVITKPDKSVLDKDSLYFSHKMGNCICGRCTCGRCKCPYIYMMKNKGRPGMSIYQQDFTPKRGFNDCPGLKTEGYKTPNHGPMDFTTTFKNDYLGKPTDPTKPFPQSKGDQLGSPFVGNSSYKTDFVDWGQGPLMATKPLPSTTVVKDLPFDGRTVYRDNYTKKNPNMSHLSRIGGRSPLSPNFPFLGDTNYKDSFKPFKVLKTPGEHSHVKDSQFAPLAFNGQYTTTNRKDFDNKSGAPCPSRIVLNNLAQDPQLYKSIYDGINTVVE